MTFESAETDRLWQLLLSLACGLVGWSLCIGIPALEPCFQLAHLVVVFAALLLASVLGVGLSRANRSSLLCKWNLARCAFIFFIGVAGSVGLIVLTPILFHAVSQSSNTDSSPGHCSSYPPFSLLHNTAFFLVPTSLVLGVTCLFWVLRLIYMHAVFMKPATFPFDEVGEVRWIETNEGYAIPTVLCRSRLAPENPYYIIYSHANATDLGEIMWNLHLMSSALGCHVLGYEYVGYGKASGPITERNCYASLQAAYDLLTRVHGVEPSRIILWGRSLGTAVSIDLAASITDSLAGMILQSPFCSILRIPFRCLQTTSRLDMFASIDKIRGVRCPVYIFHGTHDRLVPMWHAQTLHEQCSTSWEPTWWYDLGHNDLPDLTTGSGPLYTSSYERIQADERSQKHRTKLREFLAYLRSPAALAQQHDLQQRHKQQQQRSLDRIPHPHSPASSLSHAHSFTQSHSCNLSLLPSLSPRGAVGLATITNSEMTKKQGRLVKSAKQASAVIRSSSSSSSQTESKMTRSSSTGSFSSVSYSRSEYQSQQHQQRTQSPQGTSHSRTILQSSISTSTSTRTSGSINNSTSPSSTNCSQLDLRLGIEEDLPDVNDTYGPHDNVRFKLLPNCSPSSDSLSFADADRFHSII